MATTPKAARKASRRPSKPVKPVVDIPAGAWCLFCQKPRVYRAEYDRFECPDDAMCIENRVRRLDERMCDPWSSEVGDAVRGLQRARALHEARLDATLHAMAASLPKALTWRQRLRWLLTGKA
jgi:hypothetical protein